MDNIQYYLKTPSAIIEDSITSVENKLNGKTIGEDITSPFHMLMEAAVTLSGDSITAAENIIRKKFPTLAVNEHDLYHHMYDDQLANMFAIPGETNFLLYINVNDLRRYGHRLNDAKYVEVVIPVNTTITVKETIFTLLNDISIKLYDNGYVFAEQLSSDLDIAVNDIGVLMTNLITDREGVEWIVTETKVKNLKRKESELAITPGRGLNITIPIEDKFSACYVYVDDGRTKKPIKVTYSDEYIDPLTITAYVSLASTSIKVSIPDIYIVEGMISGKLIINTYTCKGKYYLPLNKFDYNDFLITIGDNTQNQASAVSTNITMVANSRSILNNGVDNISFNELRSSIINNTTGDIDLPITEYQIERKVSMFGYSLYKINNTLTDRTYLASKSLSIPENKLILASNDLFHNIVKIDLGTDSNKSAIVLNNESFTIKANTVFKYENGVITILDDFALNSLDSLPKNDKIKFVSENQLFYTPYEYTIMYNENVTTSEMYYFNPRLENIRILNKNTNIEPNTNTHQFGMYRQSDGYELVTSILSNVALDRTNKNSLRARLVIPIINSDNLYVYFDTGYNTTTLTFSFFIENTYTESGKLLITNGTSSISENYIDINSKATMYIYTTDPGVVDNSNYLMDELTNTTGSNMVVLTKESMDLVFGDKIEYIYNNVHSTYTERKYLTHTHDTFLKYQEDVYATTPDGTMLEVTNNDGTYTATGEIIHKKGDYVLDDKGVIIPLQKIGDVVLENGQPVIDKLSGIIRYVDIFMLEYSFKLAETVPYKNYNTLTIDAVNDVALVDMVSLNNLALENTTIYYKCNKSTQYVTIDINNTYFQLDYLVKPKIMLYVLNTHVLSALEVDNYKNVVGSIVNSFLHNNIITLRDVKDEIIKQLGDFVSAVSIEELDPTNSEILKIVGTNRFTLAKTLAINKSNEFVVRYDLEFSVQYI